MDLLSETLYLLTYTFIKQKFKIHMYINQIRVLEVNYNYNYIFKQKPAQLNDSNCPIFSPITKTLTNQKKYYIFLSNLIFTTLNYFNRHFIFLLRT